jgi:penicillin-binding protein 1A
MAIALVGVVGYYAYDLPDLDSLTAVSRKPSITLLSADGEAIASYGDVYGEPISLKEVPATLPQAVIATEDRHFYGHFGLDLIGLARATFVNLRAGHVVQGGSTITQQLAKNLFLTPERSVKRKIQELLMALWLEHKFDKDQILTLYLNRVYLGSGTWGVDAAARRYFDLPATQINLYQSALLAGLLKAPSRYNPQNDPEQSLNRTTQVLTNMVNAGFITPAAAQAALKIGPGTVKRISHTGRYFADWIHDLVEPYSREGRDLVVQTTLDMGLQRTVEAELEATLAGPGAKAGVSQGAMVVMSPNGAVRAMAGGRDYASSQFNRAVQGFRQPGSSFKAFLYLAAIEAGWDENSMIEDVPITTGKYRPDNIIEHMRYEGSITLRHAFAKSSNVAAVRLIEMIGPRRVVAVARRLGITSDLRAEASLALGTSEVSLLELTAGYATFANEGYGVFPYGFAQIRDGSGNVIYQRQGDGTGKVVSPHGLREMTDLMTAVVESGTGRAAAIDRPAAGKTGTSQDYRDAWFIGFTSDYVAGTWFGNDDGTPMQKITGGSLPTRLWHNVMLAAHKGLPPRPLPGEGAEPTVSSEQGGSAPTAHPSGPLDNIWHGIVNLFGG